MFNEMLPKGMDFYNIPLRSWRAVDGHLVTATKCWDDKATIHLLDDMNGARFP